MYYFTGLNIKRRSDKIKPNIEFLKELLGEGFVLVKSYERLLDCDKRILEKRTKFLDEYLGDPKWKRMPLILRVSSARIKRRGEFLDKTFGEEWRNYPRFLIMNEDRINKRLRFLNKLFEVPNDWFLGHFWFFTVSDKSLLDAYNAVLGSKGDKIIHQPGIIMKYISRRRERAKTIEQR